MGEGSKDGVPVKAVSGLLRVVEDIEGQECCHGDAVSEREGMRGDVEEEQAASIWRSSMRKSMMASLMRSECVLR